MAAWLRFGPAQSGDLALKILIGTAVRHAVGTLDDTRELDRQFRQPTVGLGIARAYIEVPGVGHECLRETP